MKFGERLLAGGVIEQAQLEAGLAHQKKTGLRIGEALLDLGYIGEETLLVQLARLFHSRYVSAAKLSRARIDPELLRLVPLKLAEEHLLFPILWSKENNSLGVVIAEPQDRKAVEELRIVTGAPEVQLYVATRDAVLALINKHYRGDLRAFDVLEQKTADRRAAGTAQAEIEQEVSPSIRSRRVVDDSVATGAGRPQTSSWTRAVERVREGSLLTDNDFIETLSVLVGLLEVHVPERQGHSARMARLVKSIAEVLEMDEGEMNHLLVATFLHDLGKRSEEHLTLLSISANEKHRALAQRYNLTPSRLFENVHLPREVNRILSHLYENADGSGLPEGLSGDRIPLGARVIAVADAFDDLTHNPSNLVGAVLEPEQALGRMRKESGSLFDPQVMRALEKVVRGRARTGVQTIVLLVDPDPAQSSELELKLVSAGFEVRLARDSDQALHIFGSEPVAAVVAELKLEPLDGLALLERLRAQSRNCPIYLLGKNPEPSTITQAFKLEVTDFLTRPFLPEVLLAKMQKELAGRAATTIPGGGKEPSRPPPAEDSAPAEIVVEVEGEATTSPPPDDSLPPPGSATISSAGGTLGRVLTGALEGKRAISLIHALAAKRHTGQLTLRLGKQKGEIFFQEGHIFQAMVGESQGEEAFLELASWQDALYRFDPSKSIGRQVIKTSTAKLIQIAKLMS